MFSRAVSLRRLASFLLRPAAAAPVLRPSPLSTTAEPPLKEAAAAAGAAPQQAAKDRPLPPHLDPAKVKRPIEIPFQPQVANTVHLVGTVGVLPVLEKKSSGEYEAVSVIVEKNDSVEDDSLQLWIPIIFQGDLAQIAADHLKENDLIYVVGQLSGDEPTTEVKDAHNKIRVFAHSLSFVESNIRKGDKMVSELDKKTASDHSDLWKDVIENPTKWWDKRLNKRNPKYPDFTHKDSGVALWLNGSPSWVLEKLPPTKSTTNSEDLWKDVIENPSNWWDNRLNKRNPKAPDFKHKESGGALWLNSSPKWVLEKLPSAESTSNTDSRTEATIRS